MNYPRLSSIINRFLLLPVLALVLALSAIGLPLGQAQTASAAVLAAAPMWDAASVSVGTQHACAITLSGGLKCWGLNSTGQLGDGTDTDRSVPEDVSGLTSGVLAVAAGDDFTCALVTGGAVKCWGANWAGQLGIAVASDDCGGDVCSKTPVSVPGLSGVTSLSAGAWHACVLIDGGVQCWGYNDEGELGNGSNTWSSTPVVVTDPLTSSPLSGIVSIAAGTFQTCALTSGGRVKCWGGNYDGQLGDGTTDAHWAPADVSGLTSGVVSISAGDSHTCAVMSIGGAKCWGGNFEGQLGDGTTDGRLTPVVVTDTPGGSPLSGVSAITLGDYHTCVLISGGGVKCWGGNDDGQLGDGTLTDHHLSPVAVAGLTGAAAVEAGSHSTCARLTSGSIQCWGDNRLGQLGIGRFSTRTTPVAVVGVSSGATALDAGSSYTCAVISGGVKCWGRNGYGQLGDGTTLDRAAPVAVVTSSVDSAPLSGVLAVGSGNEHACALMTGGGVKCWGNNVRGQAGDGTADNERHTPVDVIGLGGAASAIAVGDYFSCARVGAGVQCWGINMRGELGNNTSTDEEHTPVVVKDRLTGDPLSGITAIVAGEFHSCALTSGGGVKCWGFDNYGQLGVSTNPDVCLYGDPCSKAAVAVTGLSSGVAAIASGNYHTCALMTIDGSVKCWGSNSNGQLGNGNYTDSSTPVAVPGLTGAVSIAAGYDFTCVLLTGGSVQCWGSNFQGQLGNGTYTESLAPVTVLVAPGGAALSGVSAITAGDNHACALVSGGIQCWGEGYDGELGFGEFGYFAAPMQVVGFNYWRGMLPLLRK
jgi:alpha-tubulin suppressor-like RCC1 family protein